MEALRKYYIMFLKDNLTEKLFTEYYGVYDEDMNLNTINYEKAKIEEIEKLVDFVLEKLNNMV